MRRWLDKRLEGNGGEAGFTLIELMIASVMGVILLGVTGSLLLSAVADQPSATDKAANIDTARWVLERMTREIRNGIAVDQATASSISLRTYTRHSSCGGTAVLASDSPANVCEVTYTCSGSSCSRVEADSGTYTGTATTIFTGLSNSDSVFTYSPDASDATYVGVTLKIPNPSGTGALTVSDGASLRNATLGN